MTRTHTTAALSALFCLLGLSAHAQSRNEYQITNLTFSGGDPQYPVATDVTFTNLAITQKYADNFTNVLNVPNLDTTTIEFDSAPFNNPNTPHGALTSAILTGFFSGSGPGTTEPLDIETTLNGPTTTFSVQRAFTAILLNPTGGATTDILAVNVSNPSLRYGAGTFGVLLLPAPEPSPLAPVGFVALGIVWLSLAARRRTAKTIL